MDLLHVAMPVGQDLMNLPVIKNGKHELTLWNLVHFIILLALLIVATNFIKRWLIDVLLVKFVADRGLRYALGAIASYGLLSVGLLMIMDFAGIDVTVLTVLAGAIGIGLSLSLQNICANCFGGLLILIERPIKVGDQIKVGDTVGEVADISLRATSVITSQNTAVIVPNTEFVSSRVTNLSYRGQGFRCSIPIAIAFDEEPEKLLAIVQRAATNLRGLSKDKPVQVLLQSFSKDNSTFLVRVWTDQVTEPDILLSELNLAIARDLRDKMKAAVPPAAVQAAIPASPPASVGPPAPAAAAAPLATGKPA